MDLLRQNKLESLRYSTGVFLHFGRIGILLCYDVLINNIWTDNVDGFQLLSLKHLFAARSVSMFQSLESAGLLGALEEKLEVSEGLDQPCAISKANISPQGAVRDIYAVRVGKLYSYSSQ